MHQGHPHTCQVCATGYLIHFESPCNVGANTIRVFGADDRGGGGGLRIGL